MCHRVTKSSPSIKYYISITITPSCVKNRQKSVMKIRLELKKDF